MNENSIRLTQHSHGAGCGYRISPKALETILHGEQVKFVDPGLLVGNETRNDAAVYGLGDGTSIISTTDFFMLIVDNPFDFGRIAATNAINDIFAMSGKPTMAITIPGWPINKLSLEIAHEVTEGGHYTYRQAGIALAGDHSIDALESIFGLTVMKIVPTKGTKKSGIARAGYKLFLTEPPRTGVLATAEKKLLLKPEHRGLATEVMCRMNVAGVSFANIEGVRAMADITGFGLLDHLSGICQGVDVQARVNYEAIPKLPGVEEYIKLGVVPGDTEYNLAGYGHLTDEVPREVRDLLCDLQTSDGLLLAVTPEAEDEVKATAAELGIELSATGELVSVRDGRTMIEIR